MSLDCHLRRTAPAFVVLDPFLLAYYPLFHARALPAAVLSTKPLPIHDPLVPPYDSFLVPTGGMWNRGAIASAWARHRLKDAGYRLAQAAARAASVYTYHDLLFETARRTGFSLKSEWIRRWIQPDLHFRSINEWALWIADTDLPRQRRLPDNVRYIGSNVDVTRRQADPPVARPPAAKYLIYVGVGTIRFRWKDNLPILRKIIHAFASVPEVAVVMSTGDERATAALGTPPPNIRLCDFVPQLRILDVADLAITHAGAGTFRECIEKVVPMLAYPRNHDQFGNAARIVYQQIGLAGRRQSDGPDEIRRKALAILRDPGFKERLRRLHDITRSSEQPLLAAALHGLGVDADAAAATMDASSQLAPAHV
jgi:UDP:flavonoid glycosyltransferase YjiC (YdhE family)